MIAVGSIGRPLLELEKYYANVRNGVYSVEKVPLEIGVKC
ncbi:hypothetical protein FHS75_003504 [Novosphingobium marinum]|uniref:Uncharacterized protein n=1 Tax=Novosphingobium marinum TaxID=1514948 RepID=A0A7Z0BWB0_9SPHN|nr:hypothetical protein [Novosphingobium marinum]